MKEKKKNFFMRYKIIIIVLVFIVIGTIGSACDSGTPTTNSTKQDTKNNSSTKSKDNKKYSYDKFMQIQMGMTYEQVKAILGDGTEQSSTGDGATKAITYAWKNSDGGNLSVTLQGDSVVNKAQAFLQSMDTKVTMDKYKQIENGMSYNQVKEILGEGQLISQASMVDTKSEIYSWINANGSNMNVTFTNDTVNSKAQSQLK